MNSDATEAALGLLGLSPLNAPQSHPQPQPQAHPHHHVAHTHGPSLTSTSVGIAIDRTSAPHIFQSALPPSLVPLKRKQPSPALSTPTATPLSPSIPRDTLSTKPRQTSHPLATSSTPPAATKSLSVPSQRHPQQRTFSPALSTSVPPQTPPATQPPLPSPTSQHPLALSDAPPPPDSDAISCICGFTYDDGFSIACDDCSRWCHAACFGIVQGGEVPEFWKCWACDPTLEVDKERAVKIQKGRLKAMRMKASHGTNGGASGSSAINGAGGNPATDEGSGGAGKLLSKRKTSPGAERKSRRGSAVAAAIEGSGASRKKRRASMLSPADPSSPSIPSSNHSTQPHSGSSRISHPNGNGPSTSSTLPPSPVTFPPDIYPNPSVYAQLLRVAKAWRGVTALNPPSPLMHPPPKTYNDAGYTKVDSQGYRDRYGYSMSPLDNTTPIILDENAGDVYVPRTVLRTDRPVPCSSLHSGLPSQYPLPATCTPAHLRPPSPKLYVASDPSPFSHTSIYPSPPISNYMSPSVPSSSHPRPYAKSPLTPSTNTISSSNPNNTIPATTLLAPYTSTVVPSAAYLADPLNGYAHLGMGKPQVRLVGGGWEVGLDTRGMGGVPDASDSGEKANGVNMNKEDAGDGKARWTRCGCWPNAVVRPVICNGKRKESKKGMRTRHKAECAKAGSDGGTVPQEGEPPQTVNGRSVPPLMSRMQGQQKDDSSDQDDAPSASDSDADPTTLSFALFALRDLRADEEIVLGWEWDDGHAVHMLPALMESPGMFAPTHLHHLRAQFTSILHALSSTFTTCACGSSTRDCAVRVMESVVEGRWPWPGGEMGSEGFEDDSSDMDGMSGEWDDSGDVGAEGDGQADPRPNQNWGLGMNVDVDIEMDASSLEVDRRTRWVKKRKPRKESGVEEATPVDGGKDAGAAVASTVQPKAKKAIDLGPLVGVRRGFRTREKAPMNGGWGGVEIVPSSLSPFPEVVVGENLHVDGSSKGKGKARVADDSDDVDTDHSPSILPPRMRKMWPQPTATRPESVQENPCDHPEPAESWRAHERWRSPSGINAESPISVSGAAEGNGKGGAFKPGSLGGDGEDGADGQETEFDTETEADGLDDTRQMPPPPMPASLDPTTVSSLAHAQAVRSSSPRSSIQRDKNGAVATWVPPRTPTPTSASSGQSSQPPSQGTATSVAPARSPALSQVSCSTLPLSMSLPPPSVSPSATFSKLSLHSPDTSSAPHLSTLLSPSEFTTPSTASASTQQTSDQRAPSPPPHRPSKPLHVHPQNELPSLSVSVPAPAIALNSPDGMRDTPAEAQYQQPYRSSPESRHETRPSPDVDKKRPTHGEAYRVRFASPEVLCGVPRLREGAMPNDSEHGDAEDGVISASSDSKTSGDAGEQEVHDAMDVDVDVSGTGQGEDGGVPSHAEAPGSRTNHDPEDEHSSPQPLASSECLPDSSPLVANGATLETDSSPAASDENDKSSQVEPMSVDSEPGPPAREPSPSPPQKVKMSLKDFALRKKKQREEEMAAKALRSPATSDGAGLPSSPNLDVHQDLACESAGIGQAEDAGGSVNGHEVKMNGASKGEEMDSSPDSVRTEEMITEEGASGSPARTTSDERNNTDQTQTRIDVKPPVTLTAKMEVVDATLSPSGPVGVDDRTPNVVSLPPEPPPPPLMTKQASEITTVAHTVSSIPRSSIASSTSASMSTPASMSTSTSTSTSTTNSRSNSVGVTISTSNLNPPPHSHVPALLSSLPASRRPSHEDGEITSSTPPKAYLPRSHTPPTQPRSFHAAVHSSLPSTVPTSSSTMPVPRRPVPPLSRSPLSNATGPTMIQSSRPLPSGPRALRGSMTQPTQHTPPYPSTRPPYTGSQYIPRGPSADRDRIDWDRGDRQWTAQARPRGRAGSNGWGR